MWLAATTSTADMIGEWLAVLAKLDPLPAPMGVDAVVRIRQAVRIDHLHRGGVPAAAREPQNGGERFAVHEPVPESQRQEAAHAQASAGIAPAAGSSA